MRFASGLLADTGDLATSTAAALSPDSSALSIGWQTFLVALVGLLGMGALAATLYVLKRLVPAKVRKK